MKNEKEYQKIIFRHAGRVDVAYTSKRMGTG